MSDRTQNRSSKRLSPTVKDLMTPSQIKHLDSFSPEHIRDVLASLEWQADFLGGSKEFSISKNQLAEALEKAGMELPSPEQKFVQIFEEAKLPKSAGNTLSENLCFEGGNWVVKRGQDWVDFIHSAQQERSTYKTSSGDVKVRGKGDYVEPLKSMFVRLPPWVPLALKSSDGPKVQKVACDLAAKFASETGMPVLAVNIHSEAKHDMHLHLVFSDVVQLEETRKPNAKHKRAFLKEIRAEIRTRLKSEGKPSSPQHVKKIMDDMDIDFPAAVKTGKVVWKRLLKKHDSTSNWPKVKRSTRLLGTAYRLKGQIWDAAKTKKDKDAVRTYRENYGSFDGSFTKRFAEVEDKEDYMDWWISKAYEDMMFDALSPAQKKEVDANKRKAVASYITYGKTVISPAQAAVIAQEAAVKDQEAEMLEDVAAIKTVYEVVHEVEMREIQKSQQELNKDVAALAVKESAVQATSDQLETKLSEAKAEGKQEVTAMVIRASSLKPDTPLGDALKKIKVFSSDSKMLKKIMPDLVGMVTKARTIDNLKAWLKPLLKIGGLLLGPVPEKGPEK